MPHLQQDIYLGYLPKNLEFTITKATSYCNVGGYQVWWRDVSNFNVMNNDGKCINGGRDFPPVEKENNGKGKTCTLESKFAGEMPDSGEPIKLGEANFARPSIFDPSNTDAAGWIELKFQITKSSNKKNLHLIKWDGSTAAGYLRVTIPPNLGINADQVHILFKPDTVSKRLIVGISSIVPGGGLIILAVEIPETIDTIKSTYEASGKCLESTKKGDTDDIILYCGQATNGFFELGLTVAGAKGSVKALKGAATEFKAGKLAKDWTVDSAKDLQQRIDSRSRGDALGEEQNKKDADDFKTEGDKDLRKRKDDR
ncbi:hypothetical protein H072_207 [Dactylellina haptotyla CBS 200.50]|uniref:Uncharacterized protein n=1 Tax=Dactylellina haptotyla (strain CBS 200.50) TaxID=1284197 RepID=S8ASI0_DACHA|nr:hypothetical protein H072_207 [Dactylellina haptotyla CBS 200.50]